MKTEQVNNMANILEQIALDKRIEIDGLKLHKPLPGFNKERVRTNKDI